MTTITVPHPRLVRLLPAGVATLLLIAVWVVGSAENPGPLGFRLDDAWIHMVYGRSLASEGVLAYNPGVASAGATSPLWALVLGGIHVILGDRSVTTLVGTVLGLGACLHVALVHCSSRLIGHLTADPRAARSTVMEGAGLVLPSVLSGGAILGWNLWASGHPLPASFYVKGETDLLD